MEKVYSALEELRNINNSYEILNNSIDDTISDMDTARVCTPIIGKFSSGKSALVNTILGYSTKLLKEDITPETAVPTEIEYFTEDVIKVIRNDGKYKALSVDEYRSYVADAEKIKKIKIRLCNSFLSKIPDVRLVDMPGFESGFDIHNKAIDDYLPNSLAYIITFPADDLIVRSSVGNILKELCINDMPICIVITKYDKRPVDFDATFEKMKESLKKYIGDREVIYCFTSSFTGDAEELENYLEEIQKNSKSILGIKYKKIAFSLVENTENYLKTIQKNSQLSESELDEQEEKLNKQMTSLDSRFSKEQEDFDTEIGECVENIKDDVRQALENEESTFVTMVMNKQDIKEHLNYIVRNTVTQSIKKRFIPKVEKYLKRVSQVLYDESIGDVHISFAFDANKFGNNMTSAIVAVSALVVLGLPILGIIAGIVLKIIGDKKREEAKQDVRRKLQTEVYPQVLNEVGHGIEQAITKQIKLINTSIENEMKNQKEILEKAMSDLRNRMNEEKSRKENMLLDIDADIKKIEFIKDSLQ